MTTQTKPEIVDVFKAKAFGLQPTQYKEIIRLFQHPEKLISAALGIPIETVNRVIDEFELEEDGSVKE